MPLAMSRVQAAIARSTSFPLQAVQSAVAAGGWAGAAGCWAGAAGAGCCGRGGLACVAQGEGPAESVSVDCRLTTHGNVLRPAEMVSASWVAVVLARCSGHRP